MRLLHVVQELFEIPSFDQCFTHLDPFALEASSLPLFKSFNFWLDKYVEVVTIEETAYCYAVQTVFCLALSRYSVILISGLLFTSVFMVIHILKLERT